MRKPLIRIAVAALAAATAIVVASSPAAASGSPSGVGWSGSWEYSSATALTIAQAIPGATLSATGSDTGNSRSFTVSLTDTANDGQCAYVSWDDGALNTVNSTCNGTISFTPYGEDGEVYAQLCLRNASTNAIAHCNYLDVPSSYGADAFIRAAGFGFEYAYRADRTEYDPENWDATILLGQVWYDVYGFDNYGGPYDRLLENYLDVFQTSTYSCASGELLDTQTASSVQLCGPNQIAAGPNAVSTGHFGSGIAACSWPTIVRRGATIVKSCIAQSVPMPS